MKPRSIAVVAIFAPHTVVEILINDVTMAKLSDCFVLVTAACGNQRPLSFLGRLRDNIHNAVNGVCAPDSRSRASNDFDALNILQDHVLDFPVHTSKEWCVDAASIDQYEEFIGKHSVATA